MIYRGIGGVFDITPIHSSGILPSVNVHHGKTSLYAKRMGTPDQSAESVRRSMTPTTPSTSPPPGLHFVSTSTSTRLHPRSSSSTCDPGSIELRNPCHSHTTVTRPVTLFYCSLYTVNSCLSAIRRRLTVRSDENTVIQSFFFQMTRVSSVSSVYPPIDLLPDSARAIRHCDRVKL